MLKRDQPSYFSTSKIKDYSYDSFRTKSKIGRQKSTPRLRNNDDNNENNKSLRRHSIHSVSRLSMQSNPRDSSSDIRMIYDYYHFNQSNLRKDEKFSSNVDKYDAKRSLKWAHWVSNNKLVVRSGNFGISSYKFPWDSKFFKRISKGIPDSWRSPVWYYLATNGSTDTEFDEDLVKTYKDLLKLPSAHERQIDLDIPRTLHSHIMFRTRYGPGQRALFDVLRAFSNYDEQVGYCQGMTNIATILLMYYTEEYAFIMLTKMFTKCNLHDLYIPGFPALMESFYVQEKLMNKYAYKILFILKIYKYQVQPMLQDGILLYLQVMSYLIILY
ncbi:unnamed protein product [Rhizophagus irregularis]|nr:unnamed protein product [Rhizophagus irregularis]